MFRIFFFLLGAIVYFFVLGIYDGFSAFDTMYLCLPTLVFVVTASRSNLGFSLQFRILGRLCPLLRFAVFGCSPEPPWG